MNRVGFVGWRGMVGSVLMDRMRTESDFAAIAEPVFFSTSQVGAQGPDVGRPVAPLGDANSIEQLAAMDAIVSCQGGDYTRAVYADLRASGWDGYWIDAASALRMQPDSVIVLDPVNRDVIDRALDAGVKNYVGGIAGADGPAARQRRGGPGRSRIGHPRDRPRRHRVDAFR
jgi:aspartate-semialdehyde dehydrogenase